MTEPTIDDLISNLACATHFLPEEDCIYCDTEKIKAIFATPTQPNPHKEQL